MEPVFRMENRSAVYVGDARRLLPGVLPAGRVVVVTDANVARCCAPLLAPFERVEIPTGEANKTLQTLDALYRRLLELEVDRSTFILAVGGGIVTDVAGFAAATYLRGLRFGFVATTLLAQVDASVGGKNGVNLAGYKNMVGSFTQPEFVICDPALLHTLPDREFRAGVAEAVKAAVIADPALFGLLERSSFAELRSDEALLAQVVTAAIQVKGAIVAQDEREAGMRRLLNLGHTLAHAIEKCTPALNHGEAVAVGLDQMAGLATRMGLLAAAEHGRIRRLLVQLGFELEPPVPPAGLFGAVAYDKKREAELLHLVQPAAVGRCEVHPVTLEEFRQLLG